jgi:hypothetical protein
MTLINVYWTPRINMLVVFCDCGEILHRPSNYSMVQCPVCRRAQLWHDGDPKPKKGRWSEPVMTNLVLTRDFDPVKAERAK